MSLRTGILSAWRSNSTAFQAGKKLNDLSQPTMAFDLHESVNVHKSCSVCQDLPLLYKGLYLSIGCKLSDLTNPYFPWTYVCDFHQTMQKIKSSDLFLTRRYSSAD